MVVAGVTARERLAAPRNVISIAHWLSETPLAKLHDRALRGELLRVPQPIPWEAFDRKRYPEAALELATDLAARLANGEYASIALFTQITAGLALGGAPFDLVHAATRISSDELRHAEYCIRMAELCSGGKVTLEIDRQALLTDVPNAMIREDVDFLVLKYACIGETLAAALLTECRRRARDKVAKALFTSLAGDEVGHARFGWYYAAHRVKEWSLAERQRLADRLAEFVRGIEPTLWKGRDAPPRAAAAARALGVLDSATQQVVVTDVMSREIIPALDALGFGGSVMWNARDRAKSPSVSH
jgi:hypothetical protein